MREHCEKDGKVYVERVRERGFEHLTKGKIWSFLKMATRIHFTSHCSSLLWSSILPQTSRGSGCILALCLRFRFWASLLALLFYSLSSQFSAILICHNNETTSAVTVLETTNLCKCTHLFVNRYLIEFPSKWDGCLHTSHTFNCIPKQDGSLGAYALKIVASH